MAPAAAYYFIQVEHRKSAISYILQGITMVHRENLESLPHDRILSELEENMRDWVSETLV
jgi:hypothetical protein